MRVIIRRPHAYSFLNETFTEEGGIVSATPAGCVAGDGTLLPLPGLYVVDSEGRFIASSPIQSTEDVLDMLNDPDAPSTSSLETPASSEQVSIRVSGFMAAEGIT